MRDRKEVEKDYRDMFGNGPSSLKESLILEVLLDIRELLDKEKKHE